MCALQLGEECTKSGMFYLVVPKVGYFNLLVGVFLRSCDPQTPVAVGTSETGTADEKGTWGKVLGFHVVTLSVGWALMALSVLVLSQDRV